MDGSPTDGSLTYVGRPELRRRCGDGGQGSGVALQRCKLALRRWQAVALHCSDASSRCCSLRRNNTATML